MLTNSHHQHILHACKYPVRIIEANLKHNGNIQTCHVKVMYVMGSNINMHHVVFLSSLDFAC